jgi:hypothetical protein
MKTLVSNLHRYFAIVFVFQMMALQATAGGYWLAAGGREAGMNYCSVALTGLWSAENNLAGIASVKHFNAGIGYQNRFMVSHLGTADLAVVYPASFGNVGLSMRYFGYSLYHEMKIGVTYARRFGPKWRAGVQLVYLQTGQGDIYGSHNNFTFALGVQSDITSQLTLGIFVFNPVPVKLADYAGEKIPAIFRMGLTYRFSRRLLVTAEVEKNTAFQAVVLRAGAEYVLKKQFFLRMGAGTSGDIFSLGFGWQTHKIHFDLAANMHSTLGFSPQASLVFSF